MGLTEDPNDPRLGHGPNDEPVPQNEVYLVLSEADRARGYVRPLRHSYKHKTCGCITTMGGALAETYAVEPHFYGSTYCVQCSMHRPVSEFLWVENGHVTDQEVGS